MSERKCCDCCWWETEAELEFTELDEGECHRYPPNVPCIRKINDFGIATPEVTKGSMITTYPITYAFEWCGEFLGKENTRHERTCRPVRKEIEWPAQEGPRNRVVYECSECEAWIGVTSSYCFNCGARIVREGE